MKNLLLILLLLVGAWYLFSVKETPPAPVVERTAPPPQVDYSGVKTFYSLLNDPPVPANGNHYTRSAVNLGNGSTGPQVSVAPGR